MCMIKTYGYNGRKQTFQKTVVVSLLVVDRHMVSEARKRTCQSENCRSVAVGRTYAIRVVLGTRVQDRHNGQPEYYAFGVIGTETAVVS